MTKLMEMNSGSERKVVTVWYIYSLFNITYLSGIISTYILRWEKWHLEMLKVMRAMEKDYTHLWLQLYWPFKATTYELQSPSTVLSEVNTDFSLMC